MWTYDLMDETWNAPADFRASDGSTGINFCVDAGKNNTYQSQSCFVFPVPGKDKCFIYMGDRWNSGNVQSSRHVWLPLSVRSGYPTVRWYDAWDLTVFDEMYRMKRMATIADGSEGYLLEKYSNRIVSRPKSSLTLEDDGASNLTLVFHTTARPYTYKIQDPSTGKYLESVYGTTRWQPASDAVAQQWIFWLEEDGYFRIENAADGVCLSVSGNSTEAGTALFLSEASGSVHQSFAPYFDSVAHPAYEEADVWSRTYPETNRQRMAQQRAAAGIQETASEGLPVGTLHRIFDLLGRRVPTAGQRGLYIVQGKKILIK